MNWFYILFINKNIPNVLLFLFLFLLLLLICIRVYSLAVADLGKNNSSLWKDIIIIIYNIIILILIILFLSTYLL
jgi:hypothetical protein